MHYFTANSRYAAVDGQLRETLGSRKFAGAEVHGLHLVVRKLPASEDFMVDSHVATWAASKLFSFVTSAPVIRRTASKVLAILFEDKALRPYGGRVIRMQKV